MAQKNIPKNVKSQVKKYLAILKEDKLPIQKAFIFGSYAQGTPHRWSDIDVCIVSPEFKDSWSAIEYLWAKRPFDLHYTIEPIGFSVKEFREGSPLVDQIKNTGVEIK